MKDKTPTEINKLKTLLIAYKQWKISKVEFDKRRTIWNYCV